MSTTHWVRVLGILEVQLSTPVRIPHMGKQSSWKTRLLYTNSISGLSGWTHTGTYTTCSFTLGVLFLNIFCSFKSCYQGNLIVIKFFSEKNHELFFTFSNIGRDYVKFWGKHNIWWINSQDTAFIIINNSYFIWFLFY